MLKYNIRNKLIYFIYDLLLILPFIVIYKDNEHKLMLSILLFFFLASFSFINKYVYYITYIYISIIEFITIHIIRHWGGISSVGDRVRVALISPHEETIEYVHIYIDYMDILMFLYLLFLNILMIKNKKFINYLSYKIKAFIVVALLVDFYILILREPFNLLVEVLKSYHESKVVIERQKFLHSLKRKISNEGFYDKVIIIQGESVNRNYTHIYGYHIKNTPFLDSKKEEKYFYKFNKVLATINQTRYEIPLLFSDVKIENFNRSFIKTPSIITILKNKGYKTYWISNQGKLGKHETLVSSIANEADVKIFFNQLDYSHSKSDIVFIKFLKNYKINFNKELYIFHLIGSHFDYKKRYLNKDVLYPNTKSIIKEYLNSIYFTDKVIKSIFSKFYKKNLKILIIYLSDHGEIVSQKKHGHGFFPPYKDEYNIPFIMYSSVSNPRLDRFFQLYKNKIFNSSDLDNIILYVNYNISKLKLSNNPYNVYSLNPKNKFNYNKLDLYKDENE